MEYKINIVLFLGKFLAGLLSKSIAITADAFKNVEGKTAEEGAELFVQVAEETGFLVKGRVSAGDNETEIAFSGDTEDAQELFNKVLVEDENETA